jgi:acetyl esterase
MNSVPTHSYYFERTHNAQFVISDVPANDYAFRKTMNQQEDTTLCVEDICITGHAQIITLRSYRPAFAKSLTPIVFYFHGGSFISGTLDDATVAASYIARNSNAWVISVEYSLAPVFPFPAALEDGYRAVKWAVTNARAQGADPKRMGVAGHDAGGNLATCLAAIVRDRGEFGFSAQALLAPLLDPTMTLLADGNNFPDGSAVAKECAIGYRAYLKHIYHRMHPYASPIESKRLRGLPAALIASAGNDVLHVEAEKYSCELISAGVPTEVTRYADVSHKGLASNLDVLGDVSSFFNNRLRFLRISNP